MGTSFRFCLSHECVMKLSLKLHLVMSLVASADQTYLHLATNLGRRAYTKKNSSVNYLHIFGDNTLFFRTSVAW